MKEMTRERGRKGKERAKTGSRNVVEKSEDKCGKRKKEKRAWNRFRLKDMAFPVWSAMEFPGGASTILLNGVTRVVSKSL